MTHTQIPVDPNLLRPLGQDGMFLSGEFNVQGRNMKGWKWEALQPLDNRLVRHAKRQGSQLKPDYLNLRYEYLNPGVDGEFAWFERANGKLSFHTGTFEDCPMPQGIAGTVEVIVPHSWSAGVEFVVTQRNIRRFHSATSVQLFDGTVHSYNPQTTEVYPALLNAA